jgi:hypothetical protein
MRAEVFVTLVAVSTVIVSSSGAAGPCPGLKRIAFDLNDVKGKISALQYDPKRNMVEICHLSRINELILRKFIKM